jgi:hypothetical protein
VCVAERTPVHRRRVTSKDVIERGEWKMGVAVLV